jgi:hypothetical protein
VLKTPATSSDVKSVVAAGRVNDNLCHNDYFGLTLTAQYGEIEAPAFIDNGKQTARLVFWADFNHDDPHEMLVMTDAFLTG